MSDQEQNSMGWDNNDMQQYDDDLDSMEKSRHRESTSRSRSRSPVRRSRSRSRSHERHRDRARRINLISKRVIISNVPYEMKWQDIKDIFRKEVGEVQYVEMFETPDGKSRGSGIIEFKDKDTARKAIETMHRYKMKDRNIVVREERESDQNQNMGGGRGGGSGMMGGGSMGGGMGMMGNMGGGGGMMGNMGGGGPGITPQLLQQLGVDGPVTNTVFVSNIDYKVTWKKLKDVFKLAGNVQRVEVMQSKDGKSRGMATVSFDTQLEALQAISMFNNQTLYDRPMRVKMDSTAAKKGPDIPLPAGLRSIGMGLGLGGTPIQNSQGRSGMGMGNLGGGGGGGMGSGMSSVGGLGNMDSGMGMGSSLGGGSVGSMGGNLSGLGLGGGNMGAGSNVGLGGLGNSGLSGMGLSGGLNDFNSGMGSGGMGGNFGNSLGGLGDNRMGLSSLSSNSLSGNSFSSNMMDNLGSGLGLGGSSSNYGGSGLSSSYSDRGGSSRGRDSRDSDRSTRPDNCTVCVRNLPYSLKWQDLKEKFKAVADVRFAEIKMENGRSAGWGLVRFGNPDDAQRAISLMNRSRIDGREVDVKMYR
ncbi:myelin expression factor 2-like isoform X1 [Saccostrea echinata]|uniref:myelin expression factor 2-like isoform X1 n=1 Tax=Saccostrea echinata TaxID=191078 RepID=UPI002A824E1A|nr:myelin expression factor 2-like isoform X1 [Saccostrea echinata]